MFLMSEVPLSRAGARLNIAGRGVFLVSDRCMGYLTHENHAMSRCARSAWCGIFSPATNTPLPPPLTILVKTSAKTSTQHSTNTAIDHLTTPPVARSHISPRRRTHPGWALATLVTTLMTTLVTKRTPAKMVGTPAKIVRRTAGCCGAWGI